MTAFEPRAAHLVDRECGNAIVQPASQRCLPGWCLAQARRNDVAHDAFFDDRRVDASTGDGLADHDGAELRGSEGPSAIRGTCRLRFERRKQ
jgi:hypothetical protein